MFRTSVRLQDIRRLLRQAEELELSASSIQRLKWFLYAAEHDGNVSLTCRHFGISRSTFLRWASRFDAADTGTLTDTSRRPKTVRKPETDDKTIEIIRSLRETHPLLGKEAIAEKLQTEFSIELSSSTVGRIITRHKLFFAQTKAHAEKRATLASVEATTAPSLVVPDSAPLVSPADSHLADEDDDLASFFPIVGLTS